MKIFKVFFTKIATQTQQFLKFFYVKIYVGTRTNKLSTNKLSTMQTPQEKENKEAI